MKTHKFQIKPVQEHSLISEKTGVDKKQSDDRRAHQQALEENELFQGQSWQFVKDKQAKQQQSQHGIKGTLGKGLTFKSATPVPKVTSHEFRTQGSYSSDNKCKSVLTGGLSHLGVGGGGTHGFHNPSETIFHIDANGANLNDYSFEIYRIKNGAGASKVSGASSWGRTLVSGPDGPPASDTQLTPNAKGDIYSMDAPGISFGELAKQPANIIGLMQYGNFEEHVEIVNKKTGERIDDPHTVKWHSWLTLTRSSATTSGWMLDTSNPAFNQLGEGHMALPK